MRRFVRALTVVLLLAAGAAGVAWWSRPRPQKPAWIALKVSAETTLITAPLRPDGTVDYVKYINDRYGAGVTPENNALVALVPAIGKMDDAWPARSSRAVEAAGGRLQDGGFARWDASDLGPDREQVQRQFWELPYRPWKPADAPRIDAWLAQNAGAMQVMVEATRRPRFFMPLVSENGALSMSNGGAIAVLKSPFHAVWVSLQLRAMRKIGTGNLADAWEDLAACHRMSALTYQSWDLVTYLIGMDYEERVLRSDVAMLQAAGHDRKLLERILADLQRQPMAPGPEEILYRKEVFEYPDAVQEMSAKVKLLWEREVPPGRRATAAKLMETLNGVVPDWDRIAIFGNRFLADYYRTPPMNSGAELSQWSTAHEKRMHDAIAASHKDGGSDEPPVGGVAGKFFLPRIGETQETYSDRLGRRLLSIALPQFSLTAHLSIGKRLAMTRLACALQLYRLDAGGYPDTPGPAAEKYLQALPTDFWGRPLKYSPSTTGFKLRSVGPSYDGPDENATYSDSMTVEVKDP